MGRADSDGTMPRCGIPAGRGGGRRPSARAASVAFSVVILLLPGALDIGGVGLAAAPRAAAPPTDGVASAVSLAEFGEAQLAAAASSLNAGDGPGRLAAFSCPAVEGPTVSCDAPTSLGPSSPTLTRWTNVTGVVSGAPSIRGYGTMTYDALDNVVLLFGGMYGSASSLANLGGGTSLNDTWVYQDGVWTKLTTNATPGPRELPQMAYDPADKEVVMFGGEFSSGTGTYWGYDDTWTFAHMQWTNITSSLSSAPPGRFRGGMAYDYYDGYVLLFGGTSGSTSTLYYSDTWEFLHNTWSQLTVSGSPPGRSRFVMAYDPSDQEMVVYGGTTASASPASDTWVYQNLVWTQVVTTTFPPARLYYMAATDWALGGVLLYGGSTASGSGTAYNDTWLFENGGWTQLTLQVNGSAGPLGYGFMTFDPDGGYVLLFGGFTNVYVVNATYTFGVNLTVFAVASPPSTDLGGSMKLGTASAPFTSGLTYTYSGVPKGCTASSSASFTCSPSTAGTYNFSASAKDLAGDTGSSYLDLGIFADPSITFPVASPASGHEDVGEAATFSATATRGSGGYVFTWTGLPTGCRGSTNGTLTCSPNATGTFNITVSAKDSNGFSTGTNGTLTYVVDARPTLLTPTANRTSIDVGQSVTFTTKASSGSGGYKYAWSNLPPGCSGTAASVNCTPTGAKSVSIFATVTDSNGGTATSSPLNYTVDADPYGVAITTPNASADVGQSVTFAASFSGGSGNPSYTWSGLPSGCTPADSDAISCTVSTAQNASISVEVTDSNGISATSPTFNFTIHPDPTVSTPTANRSSADLGETIRFSANASEGTGVYAYLWLGLPTGCSSSNASSIVCAPTGTGRFDVSINITDSSGASALSAASVEVTVLDDPIVTTPVANRSSADVGQDVALTTSASSGSGSYAYVWSGLMPGCVASAARVLCVLTTAGAFSVSVTVTDSNGGSNVSAALGFSVDPALTITAVSSSRSNVDVGQAVTFSAAADYGSGGYVYRWTGLPTGCSGSASSVSCKPTAASTFVIAVSVSDTNGLTATNGTLGFTVYPDPAAAAPLSNRSSFDAGQSVEFSPNVTEAGAGGDVLNWTASSTKVACSIAPATSDLVCTSGTPGTFTVRLTVTDRNGVSVSATSAIVTVFADPTVAAPQLSRSTTDVGVSVTVSASPSGGSGNYSYAWVDLPEGCAGTGAQLTCTPTAGGTFEVEVVVTDTDGYRVESGEALLLVNAAPTASVSGPGGGAGTAGASVSFAVNVSGGTGSITVVWLFGDGDRGSGTTVSHTYAAAGTYTVWVWANDSIGGSYSTSLVVTVRAAPVAGTGPLGTSPVEEYALIGGIGAAVVLVALLLLRSRRRREEPGEAEPTAPPEELPVAEENSGYGDLTDPISGEVPFDGPAPSAPPPGDDLANGPDPPF